MKDVQKVTIVMEKESRVYLANFNGEGIMLGMSSNIQSVPLATETGFSLIILILSGRKWLPLPAHVMMSHFLHNEVSPLQI